VSTALRTLSLFTVPFAILLATASPGAAADVANPRPLRIAYVFALANAPAVIAEQKGYFAAEGLKVELKPFGDGPVIQQAIAAGEVDIAYVGAPPIYQWFARGLQSRIVAKVNYGQAALVVSADATPPISTLSDLRGRRIAGVARGSGMDVLLRGQVLKARAGLDADQDLSVVSMPAANMNAALDRRLVDGIFTWEPYVSEAILRGTGKMLLDVNRAIPHYPWYVIAAVPLTMAQRPDDVVHVLRAHRKAIAFINEHPDEADRLIAEAFQIPPVQTVSGATLAPAAVVKEARKRLGWSARFEPSDLKFIQALMNDSLAQGILARPMQAEQVVDLSWQQRAEIGR
jgi:NitT/TauT family transport system substrate-binding protein